MWVSSKPCVRARAMLIVAAGAGDGLPSMADGLG
jgi:hypothetical protein